MIRIDEAIDDVLHFVRQHADFGRVEIRRAYDPSLPEMMLDEEKIKQVFMNLILNARHAMKETGILSLTTAHRPNQHRVEVRISDTGYGIQKQDLPRIFDPFFTTKPTGEGTGLGLSVSYGIVKNHGGEILVESEMGKGSTFTVVLPLIAQEKEKNDVALHSHR